MSSSSRFLLDAMGIRTSTMVGSGRGGSVASARPLIMKSDSCRMTKARGCSLWTLSADRSLEIFISTTGGTSIHQSRRMPSPPPPSICSRIHPSSSRPSTLSSNRSLFSSSSRPSSSSSTTRVAPNAGSTSASNDTGRRCAEYPSRETHSHHPSSSKDGEEALCHLSLRLTAT